MRGGEGLPERVQREPEHQRQRMPQRRAEATITAQLEVTEVSVEELEAAHASNSM